MKIEQSAVALQSQHASASLHYQQSTLRTWVGERRPDFEGQAPARNANAGVVVSLSAAARAAIEMGQARAQLRNSWQQQAAGVASASAGASNATNAIEQANDAVRNDPRLRLLIDMVEAITGRAVQIFDARQLQADSGSVSTAPKTATTAAGTPAAAAQPAGWGVEFDAREVVAESESTRVSAQGVVRTSDGKEIRFDLQLDMSREFVQESSVSVRAGDAVVRTDPLVINFGGSGAELTDTRFAFDLNADGKTENIAFVAGNSGFLALDKNGDGRINDGTELFGPGSGNGFTDLAKYDSDGNHWIDENDAVYSQLQVWQRDANGQDQLSSLAEKASVPCTWARLPVRFRSIPPPISRSGWCAAAACFCMSRVRPAACSRSICSRLSDPRDRPSCRLKIAR